MRWLATSARSWAVGSSFKGWKRRTLASERHWRRRSASRGAAGRNDTWGLERRSGKAMAIILARPGGGRPAAPHPCPPFAQRREIAEEGHVAVALHEKIEEG